MGALYESFVKKFSKGEEVEEAKGLIEKIKQEIIKQQEASKKAKQAKEKKIKEQSALSKEIAKQINFKHKKKRK